MKTRRRCGEIRHQRVLALGVAGTLALLAGCSGHGNGRAWQLGLGAAAAAAGQQAVTTHVSSAVVMVGTPVEVSVVIPATQPCANLYAVTFDVVYDPAVLDLTSLSAGPSLLQGATELLAPVNRQPGRAVCVVSRSGASAGEAGAGGVAVLRFTARAPGVTAVQLDAVSVFDAAGSQRSARLSAAPTVAVR